MSPPGMTVKFKGYATLAFDANLVRGRLPEGHFSENVYQLKADIFLSPDLGLMNYIQFDDISNTLGWSARLRWQISPGNEIYLVYNRNWERRLGPPEPVLADRGPRRHQDHAFDPALKTGSNLPFVTFLGLKGEV